MLVSLHLYCGNKINIVLYNNISAPFIASINRIKANEKYTICHCKQFLNLIENVLYFMYPMWFTKTYILNAHILST